MEPDYAILRIRGVKVAPACHAIGRVEVSIIAKISKVEAVLIIQFVIDTQRISPLINDIVGLKLRHIEEVGAGTCRNDFCAWIFESGQEQHRPRKLAVWLNAGDTVCGWRADA